MSFALRPITAAELVLFVAVLLAALWQISWIWRYLPGAPLEVPNSQGGPSAPGRFGLLTTNVFQDRRDASALLQIISDADPDVILAVETDEWWCSRLSQALRKRYPYGLTYPLSNGYGMALFSRLELLQPTIRFLVDDAIPSIKTGVRLRSGAVIDLYGLHPQPPAPLQDSTERDIELVLVGVEIKSTGSPSVALGDLNDVAWSPTTAEFARAGGLRDPRRGRGFFNTYPAHLPVFVIRWITSSTPNTSRSAICEFYLKPGQTICLWLPCLLSTNLTTLRTASHGSIGTTSQGNSLL